MTDLAEQVAAHMTEHFPVNEFGGWEVARDTTDHTAAVIWRRHDSTLVTPTIRGQLLIRWLDHLRTAGFDGTTRTDHGVFDTARQPDGYVCWLHITGRRSQPTSGGPVASGNYLTRE